MRLFSLREPTAAEIQKEVETHSAKGHPILLLFDDGLEELHNLFLHGFIQTRPSGSHILLFRGERIGTDDEFYDECVRVMPGITSYFGRNLDALDEVLSDPDHGLSSDPSKVTCWIWRNADRLYSGQPEFFKKLFAVLVEDSQQVSSRTGIGEIGSIVQRTPRVTLILTGRWSVMASDASDPESFLHVTRWWQYRPQPPPQPANTAILRVS